MNRRHSSPTRKGHLVAFCAISALLCASCATGARQTTEQNTPKKMAQLYVDLGTQALIRGEFPQAVEDLRKAITLDDDNAMAHNHLGLSYYALGQKDLALIEVEHAAAADPKYSDAYINLGNFASEKKNYTQARKYYNKALSNLEYKLRHRALTSLAQVAMQENNTDEARRLLYQSIQANPDYCLSHFLLGSIFARENNQARASDEFKKSVANTCTSNVEAHYQLGMSYLRLKDFKKARNEFALLIDQYPGTIQGQHAGDQLKNIP